MRNVILICLDTLRKDFFDEYAPRLRERADLDFAQCRAASSWSVPSHASMFTGELPYKHGIHTYNRDFSGLTRENTFLGELPQHRALGASANVWAGSSFGFDELFDDFSDISPDRRFSEGIDVARWGQQCDVTGIRQYLRFARSAISHDHPIESLANGALVQIDDWFSRLPVANPFDDGASIIAREMRSQITDSPNPFFLFANFMDAHGPLSHVRSYDRSLHDAPLSWTSEDVDWRAVVASDNRTELERYKGLYAASIDYLDRQVCTFVDLLEENMDEETTVVVTSDHGDEMGADVDNSRWGHVESSLSESLLHVPLLVLNAPEGWKTVDTSQYVSHTDLGTLLVGLANGEVHDVTTGSIAAERIGHSGSLATIDDHRGTAADRMIRVVYEEQSKYIEDSRGTRSVHRLDESRACWEEHTECEFDTALFDTFFDSDLSEYKQRTSTEAGMSDVDESTRDRLEDLGYV